MPILHVSLDFTKASDPGLDEFANQVLTGLNGNAAFPNVPLGLPTLENLIQTYTTALTALAQGGTEATAAKNAARANLEDALRQIGLYVQGASANDLPTLLSSGFHAASTNRASVPLPKPTALVLTNGNSTQLLGKIPAVKNANSYEARIQPPSGPATVSNVGSDSRRLEFNGLTPGVVFTISLRALGGSTGASDWSDPVSHMCM